jgi:ribonucleoside-diphosphate reductase subunit M2
MHLLRAIETVPCVQQKAQWALKWCDTTTASFAECTIAFAALLFRVFLHHLLAQEMLPDAMTQLQQWTDEPRQRAALQLCMPTVLKTSQSATGITDRGDDQKRSYNWDGVCCWGPPCWTDWNEFRLMCNYIKFFADRLLITFGSRRHYKVGIHLNEWKR